MFQRCSHTFPFFRSLSDHFVQPFSNQPNLGESLCSIQINIFLVGFQY